MLGLDFLFAPPPQYGQQGGQWLSHAPPDGLHVQIPQANDAAR